jgi:hypothetical protein
MLDTRVTAAARSGGAHGTIVGDLASVSSTVMPPGAFSLPASG